MFINTKFILLVTIITFGCYGTSYAQSETEEITIDFEAWVGNQEFACGQSYENVGTSESTITPTDFRLYVSNLRFVDKAGNAFPVELEQDKKWQYNNVALIDFEDGTGVCDNGTSETRKMVVGNAPKGDYEKLEFTLGVPKNLNHKDAAIAPSPLNLTSMWWNWQGGYKFLRVDLENDQLIRNVANDLPINQDQITEEEEQHSNAGNKPDIFKGEADGQNHHQQSNSNHSIHNQEGNHGASNSHLSNKGYSIHLGSTGCKDSSQSSLFGCANPNRPQITLEDFNPNKNVVIVDLAEFLATSDLNTNFANTPNGCMSSPEDGDCKFIMESLGLSNANTEQTLFWVD